MNRVARCYKFGIQVKILLSKGYMLIVFHILGIEKYFKLNFEPLQNKYVRGILTQKATTLLRKWLLIN
jgi:hypothetical protein